MNTTFRLRSSRGVSLGIVDLFGGDPTWKVVADEVPASFRTPTDCSAFCLFAADDDGNSPICDLDSGDRIPTYLLNLDDDQREHLYFWSRAYNRMDGIWFSSGDLELPAYEQLTSHDSGLSQDGRKLAAIVESSVNKPYYRKIRLDFRHAAAFWAMRRSFSGKSGMAMRGLSFEGIFSGTS